jgi:transcriptional regulator with XRE-family HTH domain
MHRTFLGHLETGRKDFRLTTIIRIAHALGVTMAELFTGLEAGEPLNSKKARRSRGAELDRVRTEIETLERSVERLRRITSEEHYRSRSKHRRLRTDTKEKRRD